MSLTYREPGWTFGCDGDGYCPYWWHVPQYPEVRIRCDPDVRQWFLMCSDGIAHRLSHKEACQVLNRLEQMGRILLLTDGLLVPETLADPDYWRPSR